MSIDAVVIKLRSARGTDMMDWMNRIDEMTLSTFKSCPSCKSCLKFSACF